MGLAKLDENRQALARMVRENARTDQGRLGSVNRLKTNEIGNRPLA
jgi:hypothetical protein